MAKSRRSYKGAAVSNSISSSGLPVGTNSPQVGLTISLSEDMSGWSETGVPFFAVIDPGTAKEEKVCVIYSSARTLTVVDPAVTSGWTASVNGRGVDGTINKSHANGAVIYPVFTSIEADQANELVSKYTVNGDIVVHGETGLKTIGISGTSNNNKVLVADSTVVDGGVKWGTVGTSAIADTAVTSDKIASAVAGSGLGGGAGTALSVNVDNTTIEISSDALRLKDNAVTTAKIADGTVLSTDLDYTTAVASGGNRQIFLVNSYNAGLGKVGDIQIVI